jgi:hypothetical protein
LQGIARLASEGLDTAFGDRLFSLRAIAVSSCSSIASLFVYLWWKQAIVLFRNPGWVPAILWPEADTPDWQVFPVYAAMAVAFFACGFLPARIKRLRVQQACYVGAIVLSFSYMPTVSTVTAMYPYYLGSETVTAVALAIAPVALVLGFGPAVDAESADYATLFVGLVILGLVLAVLSFAGDVLFVALTRIVLRLAAKASSFWRIITLMFLNMTLAASLLVIPQTLGDRYWDDVGHPDMMGTAFAVGLPLKIFAATNVLDAFVASIFGLLCLLMLIHRLAWPIVQRPIYSLQKLGVLRRRRLLTTAGIAVIASATGRMPALFEKIAQALTP